MKTHLSKPKPFIILALSVCALSAPRVAQAQSPDASPFATAASPHALLSLETTDTLRHLGVWTALSLSYANDPAIARRGDHDAARLIAHRVATELAFGLGLMSRAEITAALPFYLRQLSSADHPQGISPAQSGPGDLRLGARVRLWRGHGVGLALATDLTLPTGDGDDLMGAGVTTLIPRLIVDWRHPWGIHAVFNAAYRLRARRQLLDLALDDELLLGAGLEASLGIADTSVGAELDAALGLGTTDRDDTTFALRRSPIELLGFVRHRGRRGLVATLAAGAGLTGGFGAADLRVIASVGWIVPSRRAPRIPPKTRAVASSRPSGEHHAAAPTAPQKAAPPDRPVTIDAARFDALARQDPDHDGDGIPTPLDACPNAPEDRDGYQDTDGCPDLDNDHDGVPDTRDRCPLQPEIINGVDDDDGCPDAGRARVVLSGKHLKLRDARVFFQSGSDVLDARSKPILRQVAQALRAYFTIRKLRVEGHTDDRGDKEMNVDLSERRARRVRLFLIAEGVAPHRLVARGFGPLRPIASNKRRAGRARNRRVTFVVVKRVAPTPQDISKRPHGSAARMTPSRKKSPPRARPNASRGAP